MHAELPLLQAFFDENGVIVGSFATEWFLTLFASALPSEAVLRIWDALVVRGKPELLAQLGMALLHSKLDEMTAHPDRAVDVLRNCLKDDDSSEIVSRLLELTLARPK